MSGEVSLTDSLNLLSGKKAAYLDRCFQFGTANVSKLTEAVNALYAGVGAKSNPEIFLAQGPSEALDYLNRYRAGALSSSGRNMADVFFQYAMDTARKLGIQCAAYWAAEDLEMVKKMIFWDLNFQVSQAYAAPVFQSLRQLGYFPPDYGRRYAHNPCIADADWLHFYTIMQEALDIDLDIPAGIQAFLRNGGMYLHAFEERAVVCCNPLYVNRDENFSLHGEDEAAMVWEDGTALYFHHGVAVPEKLVLSPDTITREDVMHEQNAEVRRCYQEILGSYRFGNLLGLVLLDADKDRFGNDLKLYKTEFRDKLAGDFIYFAQVVCPSTQRQYFLCVPPKLRTAKEAVAWSFGKSAEEYKPDIET